MWTGLSLLGIRSSESDVCKAPSQSYSEAVIYKKRKFLYQAFGSFQEIWLPRSLYITVNSTHFLPLVYSHNWVIWFEVAITSCGVSIISAQNNLSFEAGPRICFFARPHLNWSSFSPSPSLGLLTPRLFLPKTRTMKTLKFICIRVLETFQSPVKLIQQLTSFCR